MFLTRRIDPWSNLPPPVAPYTNVTLPSGRILVPIIFPVLGDTNWRNDYNDNRGSHRHTGVDIRAPKMRPIVAPFAGRLGMKLFSFWIYAENGIRCLGTHLNDDTPGTNDGKNILDFMFAPNLRHGDRVEAGQLIGYVGNSGDATGPHCHFEIYTPDGIHDPTPSLKMAQHIREPRLTLPEREKRPLRGEVRIEGCPRYWDPNRRILRVALVARQTPDDRIFVAAAPLQYRVVIPPDVLKEVGGPQAIANLPQDRAVTFYVAEDVPTQSGTARRIVVRERDPSPEPRLWAM